MPISDPIKSIIRSYSLVKRKKHNIFLVLNGQALPLSALSLSALICSTGTKPSPEGASTWSRYVDIGTMWM